jgi:hypothetical protein
MDFLFSGRLGVSQSWRDVVVENVRAHFEDWNGDDCDVS